MFCLFLFVLVKADCRSHASLAVCLLLFKKPFHVQHDSMGPKRGFSYFVFQQLYDSRQFSKLMRLGEEFQEDLAIFLKHHQDLLWLHEIFLHKFSEASETLHVLSLSPNDSSAMDSETSSFGTTIKTSLVERRRLLNLSKVAALAGILSFNYLNQEI